MSLRGCKSVYKHTRFTRSNYNHGIFCHQHLSFNSYNFDDNTNINQYNGNINRHNTLRQRIQYNHRYSNGNNISVMFRSQYNYKHSLYNISRIYFTTNNSDDNDVKSKEVKPTQDKDVKKPLNITTKKPQNNNSYLKYINPMFVLPKVWNMTYYVCWVSFDSIIHPKKGKERLVYVWKHTKDGFKHYWQGTKLLWADIRNSAKILRRLGWCVLY